MKYSIRTALLIALASCFPAQAANYAWPENYEGVMLQGFYWDSYTDTNWSVLTSQADELSQYFSLIWVPNSGYSGGSRNMGYAPQYWFTNHNSSFGTEARLLAMIEAYKERGTGIIADVVVNHRAGRTNWTDFPVETWNGRTWSIGPEGICSTDEVAGQAGQAKPTGAPDTGEDFNGARDLDHTNANVQDNVKNYTLCLLEKYGYAGFRYDMVKGYAGRYTKLYNEYSKPRFSVGEYWDGSYDAVAAWIESTGRQSAAFDFPCHYAINDAFASGDMSKLVWKANGTTDQPAGMIHFGYAQYSVTFIDNHDTYRDSNKFTGNVVAANAFILCSPGTPCIFLPHWKEHKDELKALIDARNAAGVHNMSAVRVLKATRDCYMAEVTGSKGTLAVKIGPAMDSPSGYSAADIRATGTDYCVWVKNGGGTGGEIIGGTSAPARLYMLGNLSTGAWLTDSGVTLSKNGDIFSAKNVSVTKAADSEYGYISFVTSLGADWDAVNSADRYGASTKDEVLAAGKSARLVRFAAGVDASAANSWAVAPGTYDFTVNFSNMTVTATAAGEGGGDTPTPSVDMPERLYILGHLDKGAWLTDTGVEMVREGNTFVADNVSFEAAPESTVGYFAFVSSLGADWDAVNSHDRFGASVSDAPVTVGTPTDMRAFRAGVDASSAYSWAIAPGTYAVTADFATMKVTVKKWSGVTDAEITDNAPAVYYNMQGMRVENPEHGIYIRVAGSKVSKVLIP